MLSPAVHDVSTWGSCRTNWTDVQSLLLCKELKTCCELESRTFKRCESPGRRHRRRPVEVLLSWFVWLTTTSLRQQQVSTGNTEFILCGGTGDKRPGSDWWRLWVWLFGPSAGLNWCVCWFKLLLDGPAGKRKQQENHWSIIHLTLFVKFKVQPTLLSSPGQTWAFHYQTDSQI